MVRVRMLEDIDLEKEIKVDPASIPIFKSKMYNYNILIENIDVTSANIVKQEMLSRGGDAAIHKYAINHKIDKTNVLLIGTKKQYNLLIQKLKIMNYWDIPKVREALEKIFKNINRRYWEYSLNNNKKIILGNNSKIMGILNVTPDSFHAPSRIRSVDQAVENAKRMIGEGAEILDIGAESTRPGSESVELKEEIDRVIPVIKTLREEFPNIILSIDTYKSEVAKKAIENGVDIINDISGMQFDKDMVHVVAESKLPIVIMHIKGTPKDMQKNPYYENCISELLDYFEERILFAQKNGVEQIIIDPGFGFGKRVQDNLNLSYNIEEFRVLGYPILMGHSRKSTIGNILNIDNTNDRLEGTLALTSYYALKGIEIIRVHDVKENYRTIKMIEALRGYKKF
ncbi:dihydropteroate synthase [Marinitoga sp. 38H-ov]|uniref:dihydropteroate synthase n=1 Tax=Marinitoga sp. 38H-ov TaxID=1755814 RepID=UPI0019D0DE36|nr:dihydropteroate synthase [Marinitoga sp. 38H-ov]